MLLHSVIRDLHDLSQALQHFVVCSTFVYLNLPIDIGGPLGGCHRPLRWTDNGLSLRMVILSTFSHESCSDLSSWVNTHFRYRFVYPAYSKLAKPYVSPWYPQETALYQGCHFTMWKMQWHPWYSVFLPCATVHAQNMDSCHFTYFQYFL